MGKITIEFDETKLAEAFAGMMGGSTPAPAEEKGVASPKSSAKKSAPAKDEDDGEEVTVQMCVDLAKELGPDCKPVLKEFGITSPAAIKKANLDEDELADLYEALQEGADGAEEEEEEGDEITVEDVKEALQAFTKLNGKEATNELLEEFEISSIRSLGKLDEEALMELYDAVTEE